MFDLGGTLYDYATLEPGNQEALVSVVRWAGEEAPVDAIFRAYREGLREAFYAYLPRPFYLHRDLFHDALFGMADRLGLALNDELLARYRDFQRRNLDRDFRLREGVQETLESLRGRGVFLGIVSNIDEEQLASQVELGGLAPLFDDLLSSEAARSCKPDPGIFEEALRRAGCAADEALFVGDSARQDVEGANRVGIRSVLLWHRDDRSPPDTHPKPRHLIRRIADVLELVE
jgi:putative hydrolase of the HAD superfamily